METNSRVKLTAVDSSAPEPGALEGARRATGKALAPGAPEHRAMLPRIRKLPRKNHGADSAQNTSCAYCKKPTIAHSLDSWAHCCGAKGCIHPI